MTLRDYVASVTHREHTAWLEYLEEKETEPDMYVWYLMQVACEIRRVLRKNPAAVKLEHLRIKFKGKKPKQMTKEQRAQLTRDRWGPLILGSDYGRGSGDGTDGSEVDGRGLGLPEDAQ